MPARRIYLSRTEAECIRTRLEQCTFPTFAEMLDPDYTIYVLKWLQGTGEEFRIEREPYHPLHSVSASTPISLYQEDQSKEGHPHDRPGD